MSGRGAGEGVNVIFGRRVKRNERKEKMMMEDERTPVEGPVKWAEKCIRFMYK